MLECAVPSSAVPLFTGAEHRRDKANDVGRYLKRPQLKLKQQTYTVGH